MPHISSITTSSGVWKTRTILRPPEAARPAIYLLEGKSGSVVVKDYKAGDSPLRAILGRILVLREKRAYRRLGRMPGLAPFICAPDAFSICTGLIRGRSVEETMKNGGLPLSFYKDLSALIANLHKKGIVHCDLKRASNILLDHEGRPVILDWAAAITKSEAGFFPLALLYRRLELDDRKAVIKFMLRADPNMVEKAQAEAYLKRNRSEKVVRALRDLIRTAIKRLC